MIHAWPKLLDEKIDHEKIILVGHSFGGSAISIAVGKGAPAAGLILLDPALISKGVKKSPFGLQADPGVHIVYPDLVGLRQQHGDRSRCLW